MIKTAIAKEILHAIPISSRKVIFMANVIFRVDLTLVIRVLRSLRVGIPSGPADQAKVLA
jgi:hypothetical protein